MNKPETVAYILRYKSSLNRFISNKKRKILQSIHISRYKSSLNRFKRNMKRKILQSRISKIDPIFFDEILDNANLNLPETIENIEAFENSKMSKSLLGKLLIRGKIKKSTRKIWNFFN